MGYYYFVCHIDGDIAVDRCEHCGAPLCERHREILREFGACAACGHEEF